MEQDTNFSGGNEIYHFTCPKGHQNVLNVHDNKGFERLSDGKVIVTCQDCGWKSDAFIPRLFQQANGEYLIWIYTSKDTTSINSIFNINVPNQSSMIPEQTLQTLQSTANAMTSYEKQKNMEEQQNISNDSDSIENDSKTNLANLESSETFAESETDSNSSESETDSNSLESETDSNSSESETDSNSLESETDSNSSELETDSNSSELETFSNSSELENDSNEVDSEDVNNNTDEKNIDLTTNESSQTMDYAEDNNQKVQTNEDNIHFSTMEMNTNDMLGDTIEINVSDKNNRVALDAIASNYDDSEMTAEEFDATIDPASEVDLLQENYNTNVKPKNTLDANDTLEIPINLPLELQHLAKPTVETIKSNINPNSKLLWNGQGNTRRITKNNIEDVENERVNPHIIERPVQDNVPTTIEKDSNLKDKPQSIDQNCYHYFPDDLPIIKIPQSSMVPFLQTILYIIAFSAFCFLGLRSCDEQGTKISAALQRMSNKENSYVPPYSIQVTTDNSELQTKYNNLLQQYTELEKQNGEYQKKQETLQASNQALNISHEADQKEIKKLNDKIATLQGSQKAQNNYQSQYEKILQQYRDIIESLRQESTVMQLSKQDQDFLQPNMSQDGSFLLYGQEQSSAGNIRYVLYLASLTDRSIKPYELYKTEWVKKDKRGIPFLYTWDGSNNIAVMSRIAGESVVSFIQIRTKHTRAEVVKTRNILTSTYPEILGPPSISPNGRYVAFLHNEQNEIWVKVYSTDEGILKAKTIGGGDTSRYPEWSPNSEKLYYLTNNKKGIIEWSIPKDKQPQQLPLEVYGCNLSCSPDGKYLAFFQLSETGKGQVHLSLWDIENKKLSYLQENISTVETCRPVWSPKGRFLSVILTGAQEQIVLYDTEQKVKFQMLEKTGKFYWINWCHPEYITIAYKEGLFCRPYALKFMSWFSKN